MADTGKPSLDHTLLCDDIRQELGGKFSLMGIFETISASAFPAMHPRFVIVNEWTGGKGEFTLTVRLLTPDRSTAIAESSSTMSLHGETQRHRDVVIRLNTTFTSPGTYWLEMRIDDRVAGMVPLPVLHISPHHVH